MSDNATYALIAAVLAVALLFSAIAYSAWVNDESDPGVRVIPDD